MALILAIKNISGLAPVSDYNYEVLVGDGSKARSKCLATGTIRGHRRDDGWKVLVRQLLEEEETKLCPPKTT